MCVYMRCPEKSTVTMYSHCMFRGSHFLMVWNIHFLCNLPYATCGILRHRVAKHVTATQGTHLGKYLTKPYHKNAMK